MGFNKILFALPAAWAKDREGDLSVSIDQLSEDDSKVEKLAFDQYFEILVRSNSQICCGLEPKQLH